MTLLPVNQKPDLDINQMLRNYDNSLKLSQYDHFMKDGNLVDDPINNSDYLYQIYIKAKTNYSGRVTVPVLWDKKAKTIVSNESSEIIRMFNSEFDKIGANSENFYPKHYSHLHYEFQLVLRKYLQYILLQD